MELLELQLKRAKEATNVPQIEIPKPDPIPQQVGSDASEAALEARRRRRNRTGRSQSIFAGETGGPQSALGGGASILG